MTARLDRRGQGDRRRSRSARHVLTDLETGEVAAIAFPATAVAAVGTCAAAACAAATCAAFVAKVSIGTQRQVHRPVRPALSPQHARAASAYRHGRACKHAARVHGKVAMAECPDGSLEIWPVTDSAVT